MRVALAQRTYMQALRVAPLLLLLATAHGAELSIASDQTSSASIEFMNEQSQVLSRIARNETSVVLQTAASPGGEPATRMSISSSGDVTCSGPVSAANDVVVNGVSFSMLVARIAALEAVYLVPAAPPAAPPPYHVAGTAPTLTSASFSTCGKATNPTTWTMDNVGMLGTYAHYHDDENWSVDCRTSLSAALAAGTTNVAMRLYDPVDTTMLDMTFTFGAQALYDVLQNPDTNVDAVSLLDDLVGSVPSVGSFASHKSYSVGTNSGHGVRPTVLTKPSYIYSYCNGGSSTVKYAGTSLSTAFNFITGGGGWLHATLCSTGLGMYGPAVCTTGGGWPCYIGSASCTSGASACLSDAGQRAAVALKLPSVYTALPSAGSCMDASGHPYEQFQNRVSQIGLSACQQLCSDYATCLGIAHGDHDHSAFSSCGASCCFLIFESVPTSSPPTSPGTTWIAAGVGDAGTGTPSGSGDGSGNDSGLQCYVKG